MDQYKATIDKLQNRKNNLLTQQQNINHLIAQDYIKLKTDYIYWLRSQIDPSYIKYKYYLLLAAKQTQAELREIDQQIVSANNEMKQAIDRLVVSTAKVTNGQSGWCAAFVSDVYEGIYNEYSADDWIRGNAKDFYPTFKSRNEIIWSNSGKNRNDRANDDSWLNVIKPGDVILIMPSDVNYRGSANTYGHTAVYIGNGQFRDSGKTTNINWYRDTAIISYVARPVQ